MLNWMLLWISILKFSRKLIIEMRKLHFHFCVSFCEDLVFEKIFVEKNIFIEGGIIKWKYINNYK